MTAEPSGATHDYSTRPEGSRARREPAATAPRGLAALRVALALAGLAGLVLLVVSTWATVVRIRVLTTSELVTQNTKISGADLHGVALVLVALFGLVMLVGAVRGARPAMLALAASGALALGLIIGLDVPELDNTGQVAKFYEDVSAGASTGFFLETLGGILVLVAGGLLWLLAAKSVSARWQAVGGRIGGGTAAVGRGLGAAGARRRTRAGAGRARDDQRDPQPDLDPSDDAAA